MCFLESDDGKQGHPVTLLSLNMLHMYGYIYIYRNKWRKYNGYFFVQKRKITLYERKGAFL